MTGRAFDRLPRRYYLHFFYINGAFALSGFFFGVRERCIRLFESNVTRNIYVL